MADADPGLRIVEQAAAWGADLIVVGVDGASWLERRLLGAIHERVVAGRAAPSSSRRRWRGGRSGAGQGASASPRGSRSAAVAKGGA